MKTKAKEDLSKEVILILWELWDPIGVNDHPDGRDEYSSYAPSIVRLLEDGADAFKLSEHLHTLERTSMGVSTSFNHRKHVAERLLALRKSE